MLHSASDRCSEEFVLKLEVCCMNRRITNRQSSIRMRELHEVNVERARHETHALVREMNALKHRNAELEAAWSASQRASDPGWQPLCKSVMEGHNCMFNRLALHEGVQHVSLTSVTCHPCAAC